MVGLGSEFSQLVGRDAELARLHHAASPEGNDQVVLVIGPGGIGKTTLLQSFSEEVTNEGKQVGWGVAGEWEGTPGLWPWHEALCAIDHTQRAVSLSSDIAPASQDMAELFRSIAEWLATHGANNAFVLIIEDLHEADPTAIALLAYLARRPAIPGVTIVASTRPGHESIEALRCQRIRLGGLTVASIQQLCGSYGREVDTNTASELHKRTDGNPLFIQRLVESNSLANDGSIPADVAALIQQQLDNTPPAARPCIQALAVLGSAPLDLLQRMTNDGAIEPLLRRVSSDILTISDRSGASPTNDSIVAFRHSLVRDVVYQGLETEKRFALHYRASEVLRFADASPIALAHHLSRAALAHRGPAAADAARSAARIERANGAIGEAAQHFGLAVELLSGGDDHRALAETKIEEAEVLAQLGRVEEAEARLIEVASLEVEHSAELRRRLVRTYGRLRWLEEPNPSTLDSAGLVRIATQWLQPQADLADAAVFNTALATAGDMRGTELGDVHRADKAVEAATELADPLLLAEAHLARRRALSIYPSRLRERRIDADAALRLGTQVGDHELMIRANRLALTDALAASDRERVAVLLASSPISVAGRVQHALAQSTVAALEGRYEAADLVLDETLKELSYLDIEAPALEFSRIAYAWDRGQLPEMLKVYEPLLPTTADPALRAAVALSKVLTGDEEVAAILVSETIETLNSTTPTVLWTLSMAMLAEAACAIDHPAVEQIYESLIPYAGECALPSTSAAAWCGALDRVLGLLCLRLGRLDDAVDHLRSSIVIHQRMAATPWLARSHASLAVALQWSDDADGAEEQRRLSQQLADKIDMPHQILLMGHYDAPASKLQPRPAATTQAVLVRDGEMWQVGVGQNLHHVRHSNGLAYLHLLIQNARRDWHALDLYWSVAGTPGVVESGVGVALDEQARRSYQARYVELNETLQEANTNADLGKQEAILVEIDELERELLGAFGLGGRPRQSSDSTEKARVNVRRAISRTIKRLAITSPTLASHLERSVQTGRFCRYDPGFTPSVHWVLDNPNS